MPHPFRPPKGLGAEAAWNDGRGAPSRPFRPPPAELPFPVPMGAGVGPPPHPKASRPNSAKKFRAFRAWAYFPFLSSAK